MLKSIVDRLGWALAGVLAVVVILALANVASGGQLDPPGPPGSTMKSLDDIMPSWHRVLSTSGADPCNTQRFDCVLGDVAVLDRETGLTWYRAKNPTEANWNLAVLLCEHSTTGGRRGWRLPSASELSSLLFGLQPGHPFTGLSNNDFFWTSTTTTGGPDSASIVGFPDTMGISGKSGNTQLVMCVRAPGGIQAHVNAPLQQTPSVVPLCRWFSASRGDYFTTTSCDTAPAPDYGSKAMQGTLIDPLLADVPDTVPVYLWFSATRGDYFTTTLATWDPTVGSPAHDGYDFVATLGRLYTSASSGGCALDGYFNSVPQDNLAQAENLAAPGGYGFSRTHGYMPGACP